MPKKKKITVTLDTDLWRRIKRLAAIDGRSASGYINIVMKRHIEGEERREGK